MYVIALCEHPAEAHLGKHTGSKFFNAQSGHNIRLRLPAAPTQEVQTITCSGTPASGNFRFAFRGQLSDVVDYNSSASALKTALEAIPWLRSRNITVTFSAALGNGVTMTFSHPETNGLEGYKVEIVDSCVQTSAPAAVKTTTAITTPGTSGIASGNYVVDVWAFNWHYVTQSMPTTAGSTLSNTQAKIVA